VGNQIATTNARGFTTTVVYDALDRQEVVVDALNGRTTLVVIGKQNRTTSARKRGPPEGHRLREENRTDRLSETSSCA
jgi:YD repeat-containing protein